MVLKSPSAATSMLFSIARCQGGDFQDHGGSEGVQTMVQNHGWGVAKGSSVSWVAKFKGGKTSECKLSNGWSRSYREIKLLLPAGKRVVAKLQGDKSASQSSYGTLLPMDFWTPPRFLNGFAILVHSGRYHCTQKDYQINSKRISACRESAPMLLKEGPLF